MAILKSLSIRNFRCFRALTEIELSKSTYLTGVNNSGKTAILAAINCYFSSTAFVPAYLNKTEFSAKKDGFNRTEISIAFDLNLITGKVRKARMMEKYGEQVSVKKSFTYRAISNTLAIKYAVEGDQEIEFDDLDEDIQEMLKGVSISYIHPQEGAALLEKAQRKFKARLFNNWGRHASVAEKLKELQVQWDELRKTANTYLSSTLTSNLQKIWPNSESKVDLPEKIEDIVAVSDITFRSSPSLPEVSLTSQGTGAQSTILYQTHYILDSDRSLHRGLYFPVWLLEEPESFLHADIAAKLAELLNSDEWLENIQMVVSTHSPIMLAATRKSATATRWIIVSNHSIELQKETSKVGRAEVEKIAVLMGDPNFDTYFAAAQPGDLIFIEDERELTKSKFEDAGIKVTKALHGTSEVKKFLNVFTTVPYVVRKRAFFILDRDLGSKEFACHIRADNVVAEDREFALHQVSGDVFLILLPEGKAVEDLFCEFQDFVEERVSEIYAADWNFKSSVPTNLTRAVAALRRKAKPSSKSDAVDLIRNEQDVKDLFWKKVSSASYKFSQEAKAALTKLLR